LLYTVIIAAEGEKPMNQSEQYFVQLLGTRDGWPDNMTPEEEKVMSEHFYYLKDLIKRKKVYLAGPVFDPVFGLIILSVDSKEEAKTIMDNEPSVKAGVHTYEMHPMRASLLVDYQSPGRYINDPSDKIIRKEVTVSATLDSVWDTWTTTDGVKTFFSREAHVELRIGGPFEIYFIIDAPDGLRGSEDCRILSYLPQKMLSFEWNAPPTFGELRGIRTQVILQFEEVDENQVRVVLSHVGWGRGEDWDKLFEYFDEAWPRVLENLKKRFEDNPGDWTID
jgi:uncharacterized protein YndB with AHSA1/START domain/uncharacterized protein YciI